MRASPVAAIGLAVLQVSLSALARILPGTWRAPMRSYTPRPRDSDQLRNTNARNMAIRKAP